MGARHHDKKTGRTWREENNWRGRREGEYPGLVNSISPPGAFVRPTRRPPPLLQKSKKRR